MSKMLILKPELAIFVKKFNVDDSNVDTLVIIVKISLMCYHIMGLFINVYKKEKDIPNLSFPLALLRATIPLGAVQIIHDTFLATPPHVTFEFF